MSSVWLAASLVATLAIGGVVGGVVTHKVMVTTQVQCPDMAYSQPAKRYPPGFFDAPPLPVTGKQY